MSTSMLVRAFWRVSNLGTIWKNKKMQYGLKMHKNVCINPLLYDPSRSNLKIKQMERKVLFLHTCCFWLKLFSSMTLLDINLVIVAASLISPESNPFITRWIVLLDFPKFTTWIFDKKCDICKSRVTDSERKKGPQYFKTLN